MNTETVMTPPTNESGTVPGVGSSDWFDVLAAAGNALHNAQYPLRAMELPPYPAGGTCGCHNLGIALSHIVKAQEAIRDLEKQLGEWCAMNNTALGEKRPIPGTVEYDEETELMQEAADAMRHAPLISSNVPDQPRPRSGT